MWNWRGIGERAAEKNLDGSHSGSFDCLIQKAGKMEKFVQDIA
jgi:hypothetical protein